jgi:hypothetical protein
MWFLHDREGAVLSNSQEEGMKACDFYSPARTSLPDMNKLRAVSPATRGHLAVVFGAVPF